MLLFKFENCHSLEGDIFCSDRVRHDEEVKDDEEQIIPISERIYRMQSRLEELQHAAKSAPISWGGSGIATPKAKFK